LGFGGGGDGIALRGLLPRCPTFTSVEKWLVEAILTLPISGLPSETKAIAL
jgi:hypothetical protein